MKTGRPGIEDHIRECKDCKNPFHYQKGWNRKTCVHCTNIRTKASQYKISIEKVIEIRSKTNCDLCGEFAENKNIDHDHFTGKVRGMLCQSCNTALGKFKDDIELLEKAIKYLKNETL